MPAHKSVGYEAAGRIASVALRQPEKLNAFHAAMLYVLREIMEEVSGRDDMRVLILTGAGHAFCA